MPAGGDFRGGAGLATCSWLSVASYIQSSVTSRLDGRERWRLLNLLAHFEGRNRASEGSVGGEMHSGRAPCGHLADWKHRARFVS